MNLRSIYLCILICFFFSFKNSIAQNQNYIDNIRVDSKKLSCDGILMKNYVEGINRSEFFYGERIVISYENITGFNLENNLVYPNMEINVTNKKGDTILSQKDLFKDIKNGYTEADLNLRSNLTFAQPMLPNNSYTLHIHIVDKRSDAYYNLQKDFSIIHSPSLSTKTDGFMYDVMYLYSQTRDLALIDHKVETNEKLYLLLEGLNGYTVDGDGKVDISATISLKKSDGTIINEIKELFPDKVSSNDLKDQLYASIVITDPAITKPIDCFFKIKDNVSGHSLETSFKLYLK